MKENPASLISPLLFQKQKEKYEGFISVMVQIVEKYGKIVLQELNHVA